MVRGAYVSSVPRRTGVSVFFGVDVGVSARAVTVVVACFAIIIVFLHGSLKAWRIVGVVWDSFARLLVVVVVVVVLVLTVVCWCFFLRW